VVGGGGIVGLHSDWAVALCQPRRFAYMSRVSRSDAMEEKLDDLCHAAGELGVPAFMFQEGDDPIAAHRDVCTREPADWSAPACLCVRRNGEHVHRIGNVL
jgi:hypothetical protein